MVDTLLILIGMGFKLLCRKNYAHVYERSLNKIMRENNKWLLIKKI